MLCRKTWAFEIYVTGPPRCSRRDSHFLLFGRALDFFRRRHAQNFLDRRDARAHHPPAVFGERAHAGPARGVADLVGRSGFQNQLADFLVRVHPLKNGVPAEKIRCCGIRGSRRI